MLCLSFLCGGWLQEIEEMKLNDPKFGLRSAVAAAGGDSAIDSSSLLCVSALSKEQHTRISELECQVNDYEAIYIFNNSSDLVVIVSFYRGILY